ncbi:hypothetical protein [Frigidibacter mobilis]|uniref:Uncharacterized protein n=1 Tax=Frigidibacter mobilis TaxID=1335048 RepID=A0A159Z0S4_9RHOB|nr:hypothetical protein [Frigidibacter mobilis]AMY68485.1 hypothetical protein AKL17_1229 [Frigidibacter mobilis]
MVKAIQDVAQRRLERRESRELSELETAYGIDRGPDWDEEHCRDADEVDLEAHAERFNYSRARLDALFSDLTLWVTVTAVLSLDYAMPLVAGAIAALSPYLISDLITALAVTESPPTAPEVVALPAAGLN